MKNSIKFIGIALATLMSVSCAKDVPGLNESITDIKIIVTPGSKANIFKLQASRKDVIGFWDLGNGITVNGVNEAVAEYPFSGNYTVSMQGYSNGGKTNKASVVIPVPVNNFELLSDPIYSLLAGSVGSREGKTWVVDSMLYGHLTNLNTGNLEGNPNNTAIAVDMTVFPSLRSGELRLGKTIYDDEATFVLSTEDGQAFRYSNNGSSLVTNTGSNVFMNETFMKAKSWQPGSAVACNSLPLPSGFTGGYNSDWQVACTPPANMAWLVNKAADGKYYISFPDVADGPGGFLFFALDWRSPYQILSITEDRMVVQKETLSGTNFGTRSIRRLVIIRKGSPSGVELASVPEEDSYIK